MYHKLTILGNLGRDPEMRYTPDGTPITTFSVATNRKWQDGEGRQQEETIWFKVTAWRRLAETCNQYLQKGQQVLIEGRLYPDKETGGPRLWEGKDGKARASYEVTATTVKFLGRSGTDAPEDSGPEPEENQMPF